MLARLSRERGESCALELLLERLSENALGQKGCGFIHSKLLGGRSRHRSTRKLACSMRGHPTQGYSKLPKSLGHMRTEGAVARAATRAQHT